MRKDCCFDSAVQEVLCITWEVSAREIAWVVPKPLISGYVSLWHKLRCALSSERSWQLTTNYASPFATCSCDHWDNVLDSWVRWWRSCPPPEGSDNLGKLHTFDFSFHIWLFLPKDADLFCSIRSLPQTSKWQGMRLARLVPYQIQSHCHNIK